MRVRALPLALLATLLAAGVAAQPLNLASVNWVKYLKLSGGNDLAHSTCIFGDYLAVVGEADGHPALVLLDKSTGEVVRRWVGEGYGDLLRCVSAGNVLYAVMWILDWGAIYAFDKDLHVLNRATAPLLSITYDGEYLYSGGFTYEDINGDRKVEDVWYIEKRIKSLELVKSKELYAVGWKEGSIFDVGINTATGELWAVGGYIDTTNRTHSLIVIFDRELRELRRIDYPEGHKYYLGWLDTICFDSTGNAYVGGGTYIRRMGVAKLDKSGNALKVNKGINVSGIACVNGLVYVFANERVSGYWTPVLYVLDSGLNVLERHVPGGNVNADSLWGGPCFDGRNIYVAGIDFAQHRCAVYSLAVKPSPPSPAEQPAQAPSKPEVTLESIVNNYQVEYDRGGLSAALAMIKSAVNYIDATINVKVSGGSVKGIEPELALVESGKLLVQPIINCDVRKIDEEHYSIHVEASGFATDTLFSLIRAYIGSKVGATLFPYEKMLIDTKPVLVLVGFKVTDAQGGVHEVRLEEPKPLPYLFELWQPPGGMVIDVLSPVHLLVIDTQGRRVGALLNGNVSEVNEIPGAFYTGPMREGEFVYLPPSVKQFKVDVLGVEDGNYTLRVLNVKEGASEVKTYVGKTKAGEVQEFEVSESGIKPVSPAPWYMQYWYIAAMVSALTPLLLLLPRGRARKH